MLETAVQNKIDAVKFWWHSIPMGDGVVTPGQKTPETLAAELAALELPPLQGRSVLDIGAWDGYFSFECERRGAARVVALDHYVWSIDLPRQQEYWRECRDKGITPRPYHEVAELWRPDELPGRCGFDTAREILDSQVEPVVGDFMEMDLAPLGTFDVVLYLGVLYHIQDPFVALRRLASVTRGVALIETEAIRVPGREGEPLWEFYESNELNGDVSNWWAPTEAGLLAMCRAAGFRRARALGHAPDSSPPRSSLFKRQPAREGLEHYRLIVQAEK